jgi:hypothetical protein
MDITAGITHRGITDSMVNTMGSVEKGGMAGGKREEERRAPEWKNGS